MSEDRGVDLNLIGRHLLAIQAEQRKLRAENKLIRHEIGKLASRDDLLQVLRVLSDRIGNSESLIEARFDALQAYLGARLDRLEALSGSDKTPPSPPPGDGT